MHGKPNSQVVHPALQQQLSQGTFRQSKACSMLAMDGSRVNMNAVGSLSLGVSFSDRGAAKQHGTELSLQEVTEEDERATSASSQGGAAQDMTVKAPRRSCTAESQDVAPEQ